MAGRCRSCPGDPGCSAPRCPSMGHRNRLKSRTSTSKATIAIRIMAARKSLRHATTGIATMHPANSAQTAVCASLTARSEASAERGVVMLSVAPPDACDMIVQTISVARGAGNVGGSELIATCQIPVQDGEIVEDGLRMAIGTVLRADVIVYATGYRPHSRVGESAHLARSGAQGWTLLGTGIRHRG